MALLETLGIANAGIGLLGSLFGSGGGDLRPEQRQALKMLKLRAKQGIDPNVLADMRMRARSAVGNEASGLASATTNRLLRQGAPVAKQEQVLDKLNTRRLGATGDALTQVDALNEQTKADALSQFSGLAQGLGPEPSTGDFFSQLLGQGLGSLQTDLAEERYFERLEELRKRFPPAPTRSSFFDFNSIAPASGLGNLGIGR